MRLPRRAAAAAAALAAAAAAAAVAPAAAAGLSEHFWMNAGGGGLDRFGPDLVGSLVGGQTGTWQLADGVTSVPLAWDAYRSFRYGVGGAAFGYDLAVATAGTYDCGVHLVEWEVAAAGERVVAAEANGVKVGGVDVFQRVGRAVGHVVYLQGVDAARGVIALRLSAEKGNPMVSAVTCSRVGADPGPLPDASASPLPDQRPTVAAAVTFPHVTGGGAEGEPDASPAVEGPDASPAVEGADVDATGLVDKEALQLEDDQFRQEFDVDVAVEEGQAVAPAMMADLKDALSGGSETAPKDWRVAGATTDVVAAPATDPAGVLAVRASKRTLVKYGLKLAARLAKGKKGTSSFDSVVKLVSGGGAKAALLTAGYKGVSSVGFGRSPVLSSAAATRTAGDSGGISGGRRAAIIVGSVLGALTLLALLGAAAFFAARRRPREGGSRNYDAPPPADASVVGGSEADVEVGGGPRHSEYLEDPDSRLTSATDEMVEEEVVDSGAGVAINKDVWGRGTGSDF